VILAAAKEITAHSLPSVARTTFAAYLVEIA
jgi:hypothetical protein